MIVVNEEFDFIMKNIKAVNALIESHKLATTKVPAWISKKLKRSIEQRINEFPPHEETEWNVAFEDNEKEIQLTQNIYSNDDYGIYYGIESICWDCLVADEAEAGMWIYLFYRLPDKPLKNMKQKINDWEEELKKRTENNKSRLNEKYQVLPEDGYLVTYQLNEILNAEKLGKDPESAVKNTVDKMIEFVIDTHELLVAK